MEPVVTEKLTKIYPGSPFALSRKRREPKLALKDVSIRVEKGEIFGLLGPNGAGKTTLVRILTTAVLPTSGKAYVCGFDVVREAREVRRRVNTTPEGARSLYWRLTGEENLLFFAGIYGMSRKDGKRRARELLRWVGLYEDRDRLVETYSRGMRQKLMIAKALINDPEVLFLDEPTLGLDPRSALEIRALVKQLPKEGKTIFYTTHYMMEAEEVCDRVAIIDQGRIIACDTPENLKRSVGKRTVRLLVKDLPSRGLENLGLKMHVRPTEKGQEVLVELGKGDNPAEVFNELAKMGARIVEFEVREPTLEDVFLALTGKRIGD